MKFNLSIAHSSLHDNFICLRRKQRKYVSTDLYSKLPSNTTAALMNRLRPFKIHIFKGQRDEIFSFRFFHQTCSSNYCGPAQKLCISNFVKGTVQ